MKILMITAYHLFIFILERVCVPINPQVCEKFDPLAVPTLSKLSAELNVYDAKNQDESDRKIPGKELITIIIHI